MVRDGQGRLYTGISTDVARRFTQHQSGKGARALRGRGPLQLVWQQAVGDQSTALRLEYALKQKPKTYKEALVRGEQALVAIIQPTLAPAQNATQPSHLLAADHRLSAISTSRAPQPEEQSETSITDSPH